MGKKNKRKAIANESDRQKTCADNFFWAVNALKKVSKKTIEVNPQNLRELLAKSPHAIETWACKAAILKATQVCREDLLHILIEAGAIIQHPLALIHEKGLPEDRDDSDSGPPSPVYSRVTDGGIYAFVTKAADLRHNKLNDQLRAADSAEAVKALLDAGAQPNYFGSYGCTAVHEAAYSGKAVCLFALLQRGGNNSTRSAEGRTPLHAAAIGGNKTCVEVLIKAGVDVKAADYCSMTALHFAAGSARSAVCVPLLLEAGADVNGKDGFEMTPLHYAAAYGTAETVKLLLDEGADREALDQWYRTPGDVVYGECETPQRKESRSTIYWLLNPKGGGDELVWEKVTEDFIWDEEPPLPSSRKHWRNDLNVLRQLACYGDVALKEIKVLLNRNPSLLTSYSACKALQTCAEIGKKEIIILFVKKGANPNRRESDFSTDEVFEPFVDPGYLTCSRDDWPLIHIAAAAGQVQTIDSLLAAKASKKRVWVADYPDPFGPVEAAAANGHLTAVKFLLVSGCVTDREQLDGALRLAVTPEGWEPDRKNWDEEKQMRVARTLLDAGADPNTQDVFGHTPLLGAASCGWTKCLSLLIRRGSNVLAETHSGKTPLHAAACGGHTNCVCLLLDAGAKVCSKDSMGRTPLHYVAEGWTHGKWAHSPCLRDGATETVIALLNAGADKDSHDSNGATALHVAAESGNSAVVEVLLNAGAFLNAKDRNGRTPLHYAADGGSDLVVQKLMKSGADPDAKDRSGRTARGLAKFNAAPSLRSNEKNDGGNLENEEDDDDESECSWCGFSSNDESIEENSEDDTGDWEQEYFRWIQEMRKISADTSRGDLIVGNQSEQNVDGNLRKDAEGQLDPDVLREPGQDVKTESEDNDVWDDSEESDEEYRINEFSIKWRLRGYAGDSESDFVCLPDDGVPDDGVSDDRNAPWYKTQWIKENRLGNKGASQEPSKMDMQGMESRIPVCKTENNFCSRLEVASPSVSDHGEREKVKIDNCTEGTVEKKSDSIQETQVSLQVGGNQRNQEISDEREGYTKELRIKVELDVEEKEETPSGWNVLYTSGAWTRPEQTEENASEESGRWNRSGEPDKWFCGGSPHAIRNREESRASCGQDGGGYLQERKEEFNLREKKRCSVWFRLGKRSSDEDTDGHHNSIVVTRILNGDTGQAVRYVQDNSLDGCEGDARGKHSEEDERQTDSNRSRLTREGVEWERYQDYKLDQPHFDGGQDIWNEEHSMHEHVGNYNLTKHDWVRQSYESSEQIERIVYVQDEREDSHMVNERNVSDELQNQYGRLTRGWCNKKSLEEEQIGVESNVFEMQERTQDRAKDWKGLIEEEIYGDSHGREGDPKRHDEEKWGYHVKVERKQGYGSDHSRHEKNELKIQNFHDTTRYCPQEEVRDKYHDWDRQISHMSVSKPGNGEGSSQFDGQRSWRHDSYDQRSNSDHNDYSTLRADWERQDQLDRLRREMHRSHEREDHELGLRSGFRDKCNRIEGVSEERENESYEDQNRKQQLHYPRRLNAHENEMSYRTHEQERDGYRKLGDDVHDIHHHPVRSSEKEHDGSHSVYKTCEEDYTRSHGRCSEMGEQEHNILHSHHGPIERDQDRSLSHYGATGEEDHNMLHSHYRSREHAHDISHSPISRFSEPVRDQSGSQYGGQEREKLYERDHGKTREQAHDGSGSQYSGQEPAKYNGYRSREPAHDRSRSPYSRFGEQENDRSRKRARNRSGSRYSGQEHKKLYSEYRSREHAHDRSRSPYNRFSQQEHDRSRERARDKSGSQYSGQEREQLYSQYRSNECGCDRSRSPCRRLGEEVQDRLREYRPKECGMSASRYSGSAERDYRRSYKQHIWPDILKDVPH